MTVASTPDNVVESRGKPIRRATTVDPLFHGFDLAARSQLRVTSYDTKVAKFKWQYFVLLPGLMCLIGMAAAGQPNAIEKQKEALRRHGISVWTASPFADKPPIAGASLLIDGPRSLNHITLLEKIQHLHDIELTITDSGQIQPALKLFQKLPGVGQLTIASPTLTVDDMQALAGLENLTTLKLQVFGLTPEHVRPLHAASRSHGTVSAKPQAGGTPICPMRQGWYPPADGFRAFREDRACGIR